MNEVQLEGMERVGECYVPIEIVFPCPKPGCKGTGYQRNGADFDYMWRCADCGHCWVPERSR